jgi:hypothetical protein
MVAGCDGDLPGRGCDCRRRHYRAVAAVVLIPASMIADAADGADGTLESPAYPDDPASGSAFTTEANADAQYPKECLPTTKAACQRAGIFGQSTTVPRNPVAISAGGQEIGGAARRRAALGHNLAHAGGAFNWPGRHARECASALVRRWRPQAPGR